MNTHRKRVFAAALAVAVAGTSFNVASYAVSADTSKEGRVITAFEELEDDVAYQYLPVGAKESEIYFPEELKVKVYSSKTVEPEEPAPEEPAPEEPEPVSENEGTDEGEPEDGEEDGDLSAAIKNAFGVKTVYAAEGEEPAPEEPAPEEPAPEEPAPEEPAPEEPAIEEPAPEEPAPVSENEGRDEGEPGNDEGTVLDPGTDEGQVSDNNEPAEPETEPEVPEDEEEPGVIEDGEEKILTNIRWKLVRDESAYSRFEALLEGDVFVYELDLSRYPLTSEADLPRIKVTITAKEEDESVSENEADETVSEDGVSENGAYPEFSRMMICGGARIKVDAPEGVFPEGAELSVKKIDGSAFTDRIDSAAGTDTDIAAFDITIRDADGNEIQPRTEYGTVTVTFENVDVLKENAGTEGAGVSVYHFADDTEAAEKLNADIDLLLGSAEVETDHFSTFVIVTEGGTKNTAGASRSLSDNEINVIIDPRQFTVKDVSETEPVEPAVKLIWISGNGTQEELVEDTDYTLKYSDNTEVGTGKVTITGEGMYEGVREEYFDIVSAPSVPKVLFRGENETVDPYEKPKEWYNTGVRFSGKAEGELTFKAKIGNGVYGDESESFKNDGKNVEAKVYLSSNTGAVYFLPQKLNVDLTTPKATINVSGTTYEGLGNDGTVAHYINKPGDITANGSDETSGVAEYGIFITESPTVKTLDDLKLMSDGQWRGFTPGSDLPVTENKNNFIYVRIKDKAGNTGFASSKGVCFDTEPPVISDATYSIVNGKVTVSFNASDNLSGIEKYYALMLKSSATAPTADQIIQKGTGSDTPSVEVGDEKDAKKSMIIYCVVTDKAGNVSEIKKIKLGSGSGSPTGSIKVMDKTWNSLQTQAKTVAYTKEKQEITITAADSTSGVESIEYLVSPKFYASAGELAALSANVWNKYLNIQKPEIEHNRLNYVYAKITNNDGNIRYLSTEGICHDSIKPTVSDLNASKPKDSSVKVSIVGEDELSGVEYYFAVAKKINESAPEAKTVESDGTKSEKKSFELTGLEAGTDYKVYGIVRDRAGNISEVKDQSFATKKSKNSGKDSKSSSKKGSGGDKKGSSKAQKKALADAKKASGSANSVSMSDSAVNGGKPFIGDASAGISTGETLTSGWDRINSESVKASEPAEMHIKMNGETVIPADLLKTIAKKNISVYFELDDDVIWNINGLSFTADPTADINLSVKKDIKSIPSKLVEDTAENYPHFTLELAHNGDFGFKAVLSLPMGDGNKECFANLFYYDEPQSKLEFMGSSEVNNVGRAEFEFTHASDYLIVIRGQALDDMYGNDGEYIDVLGDDYAIKPKSFLAGFFSWDNKNLWILIITLLSLGLCVGVIVAPEDRKKAA